MSSATGVSRSTALPGATHSPLPTPGQHGMLLPREGKVLSANFSTNNTNTTTSTVTSPPKQSDRLQPRDPIVANDQKLSANQATLLGGIASGGAVAVPVNIVGATNHHGAKRTHQQSASSTETHSSPRLGPVFKEIIYAPKQASMTSHGSVKPPIAPASSQFNPVVIHSVAAACAPKHEAPRSSTAGGVHAKLNAGLDTGIAKQPPVRGTAVSSSSQNQNIKTGQKGVVPAMSPNQRHPTCSSEAEHLFPISNSNSNSGICTPGPNGVSGVNVYTRLQTTLTTPKKSSTMAEGADAKHSSVISDRKLATPSVRSGSPSTVEKGGRPPPTRPSLDCPLLIDTATERSGSGGGGGVDSDAAYSPFAQSPSRKSTLFSSIRRGKSPGGDKSPRILGTISLSPAAGGDPSAKRTDVRGGQSTFYDASPLETTPPKSFLDHFRPRSKSDSRNRSPLDPPVHPSLCSTVPGVQRAHLATIHSVDESGGRADLLGLPDLDDEQYSPSQFKGVDSSPTASRGPPTTPPHDRPSLFIDTKLATCQPRACPLSADAGGSRGAWNQGSLSSHGLSQSWGKGGKSPLAQMMERIKAANCNHAGGRQRSNSTSIQRLPLSFLPPRRSSLATERADNSGPVSSDFAKMNISSNAQPAECGDRMLPMPLPVPVHIPGSASDGLSSGHLRLMPQHSLDTFLGTGGSHGNGGSTAIIYKTDSQQFIFGNDVAAMAMSNLENENLVYSEFMRVHKCYDLIPTSSKLVVFDTELLVKKAFFALVYNGVRAAPLWDHKTQQYVGMLTITDFISVLQKQYNTPGGVQFEIEDHKIRSWKGFDNSDFTISKPIFYSIDVNESLFNAVRTLCERRVHRLPVTNAQTGNVLYILTHKRILKFLFLYMYDLPKPKWMTRSPKELGIGTWSNISQVHPETPLISALNLFIEKRVSALPVVNEKDELVNIYSKFDVINMAAEKAYDDLDITVQDALKHRAEWFEGVSHCLITDSLWTVVERLVKVEVHRMIITDPARRVVGIVSLSDLLTFLILKQAYEQGAADYGQYEEENMEWH